MKNACKVSKPLAVANKLRGKSRYQITLTQSGEELATFEFYGYANGGKVKLFATHAPNSDCVEFDIV